MDAFLLEHVLPARSEHASGEKRRREEAESRVEIQNEMLKRLEPIATIVKLNVQLEAKNDDLMRELFKGFKHARQEAQEQAEFMRMQELDRWNAELDDAHVAMLSILRSPTSDARAIIDGLVPHLERVRRVIKRTSD